METLIYGVRNKVDGKMYVGKTTNWKRRKNEHIHTLKGNKTNPVKLYQAGRKHSLSDFEFVILEEGFSSELLHSKEEYWIQHFDSVNNGYNVYLAPSDKPTFIGRVEQIGEKGLVAPNNLKAITKEEWIKRREENPRFRTSDLKIKKERSYSKVYELNESLEIIDTIESIVKLFSMVKAPKQNVERALKKNGSKPFVLWKVSGRIFIKEKDYKFPLISIKAKKIKIPIQQGVSITLTNGIDVKEFSSRVEAANFLQVAKTRVNELLVGTRNKGKGKIVPITNIKGWRIYNKKEEIIK